MKKLILLSSVICLMASCSESELKKETKDRLLLNNSLSKLLIGTWVNEEDSVVTSEIWFKENDTLMIGGASVVKGADTLFSEKIKIINTELNAVYIPQVADQNEGREVVFNLTFCDSIMFSYSNEKHDFPQHIEYKFITKDSLVAKIYGTVEGKTKEEVFAYQRK